MTHGLGCIHEPLVSNWKAERIRFYSADSTRDNREFCGEVTDQGPTSSCVAHAISNAIEMLIDVKPCILSIYALARIHSGSSLAEDRGASIAASLAAVAEHGYLPENEWSFDPGAVHNHPSWRVSAEGFDQIGLRWHAVDGDRALMISAGIGAVLPVVVGTVVDDSFQTHDGTWEIWPGCESGGGHAMLIVGEDPEAYIVKNSWGKLHGIGGYSRIAKSHILDENRTQTVAIIDAAEAFSCTG